MSFLMRAILTCAALTSSAALSAQVLWKTTLNPQEEPMPLYRTSVVNADAGAIYVSSVLLTSDVNRVRVSKLSSTGDAIWVRWVDGSPLEYTKSLFSHSDGSVSQVVVESATLCAVNFTSAGEPRGKYCVDGSTSNAYITQALDGDLIFAVGDYERTISKRGADGTPRWSVVEQQNNYRETFGAQIDSAGNYLEVRRGWFSVRRATDGSPFTSGALPDTASTNQNRANSRRLVTRANGEFVFLLSETQTSNALVARVARFRSDGVRAWSREVIFPTAVYSSAQSISLFAEGTDDVVVAREGQTSQAGSEIARLGFSGVTVWQKHLSRISSIVPDGTTLKAIRTDVGVGITDSFIFPISSFNGSLEAPLIYTRSDEFSANSWFPASNGMVAAFQRDLPNSSQYTDSLASTLVFLRPLATERWVHQTKFRRAAQITDAACLMPKLTKSSPGAWWGRAARYEPSSYPTWLPSWFGRSASDGAPAGQSPTPSLGCGFPVSDDGGQISISVAGYARAKKVTSSGATAWQAESQLNPTQYPVNTNGVQLTEGSGETTYAVGNLVGRVNATGAIAFEVLTNLSEPRFVTKDAGGNTLVVYSNNTPAVAKVSPSGTLLWTTPIDVPTCSDLLTSTRKLLNDDILLGTQSCGEGRVFRIGASGAVVWQRIVPGDFSRPYVLLKSLAEDAAGNVYAGGCSARQGDAQDRSANALLMSWTAAGNERWSQSSDLAGDGADCVTSIAIDSAGNSIAIVSATGSAPQLWSLSSTGAERWRDSSSLSNPLANDAEAAIDPSDNLLVLGQSSRSAFDNALVTLRKISLSSLGSNERIKFVQVPSSPIGFRVPFTVRLGLRDASDQPVIATTSRVARIALAAGSGNLAGALSCTIAAGSSECSIAGVFYDRVESGVALSAWGDGMPASYSAFLSVIPTPTTTSITLNSTGPLTAYDIQTIEAVVTSPAVAPLNVNGYMSDPSSAEYGAVRNCSWPPLGANELARRRCDLLVRSSAFPVSAGFVSYASELAGSNAQLAAPTIAKAQTTLSVIEDPYNTGIAGDRVRFQVKLQTGANFNLVPYVAIQQITMSSGACLSTRGNTGSSFNQPDRYFSCETTGLGAGSHAVTVSFAGDNDLLPAQPVTRNITLGSGGVIRGSSPPYGATLCSPNPSVVCSSDSQTNEWQCSGPAGMSGQLFFVPSSGNSYVTADSPISFNDVNGVVSVNQYFNWTYDGGSCRLDVDGDGARMAGTDGVIILRRMLGLSGEALLTGATHSCVPLSAAGVTNRISVPGYDLDGNGQVDANTDGLMLLRVMLGFRGSAVTTGAIGQNATRTSWNDVRSFLWSNCNLYLN